jgi:hypothetical protein
MMKTSEDILVLDDKVIITKSGRTFRPYHKDLLDNLPPDLVTEAAKRKQEEIKKSEKKS